MFNLPIKLAILAEIPSPSAGGVVLYRILKDLNPDDYYLLYDESYEVYSSHLQRASLPESVPNSTLRVPAQSYYLPSRSNQALSKPEEGWPRKETPVTRKAGKGLESPLAKFVRSRIPEWLKPQTARELINDVRTIRRIVREALERLLRVRNTARIVKRERCGAILGFSGTGDPFDLPACYLASRLTRVPFYAYLFDDYMYQWKHTVYHRFARLVEPLVLKGAAGVIVPNEFSRDEYQRRYQIEPLVVRNALEIPKIEDPDVPPWPTNEGEIRIVYTGTVSMRYHYDTFYNLIAAISQLDRPEVKLHLYTAQTPEELERQNISGPIVYHEYIASSEVFEAQRKADILFLPLSFDTPIPEVIRTASPGKMGEYLASERPILVHAPSDSFVSWYFREHECGMVVDRSEPAMLAQAIERVIDEANLRRKIGERARVRAESDFSLATAQAEFVKLLQSGAGK